MHLDSLTEAKSFKTRPFESIMHNSSYRQEMSISSLAKYSTEHLGNAVLDHLGDFKSPGIYLCAHDASAQTMLVLRLNSAKVWGGGRGRGIDHFLWYIRIHVRLTLDRGIFLQFPVWVILNLSDWTLGQRAFPAFYAEFLSGTLYFMHVLRSVLSRSMELSICVFKLCWILSYTIGILLQVQR